MKDTNHPSRFGFVKRRLVQLPLLLAIATGLASILNPISAHAGAGAFVTTGSLVDGGRSIHNAVRLRDGRVLVVGGLTADSAGLHSSAETYDPNTGDWSLSGALSTPRYFPTANLLPDGRVLVAGGGGGAPVFASTEIWNPTTGEFTAGTSMSVARMVHSSVALSDGRILVAGGTAQSDGAFAQASAEIYDPVTGTWTATGSMATSRNQFVAVLLADGRVLIAGGAKGAEGRFDSIANCEIYNPSTGTFTPAAPMSKRRGAFAGVLLADGRVLVAAGYAQGGFSYHDAEIYDPSNDSWSPAVGSITAGGVNLSLTRLLDGRVLVAGGINDDNSAPEADADLFDPATSTFSPLAPMHVARESHSATLLGDGSVLLVGGVFSFSGPPYATASVERFVPPDVTPPVIACPAGISVPCSVDLLLPVAFSVTATDDSDPSPTVTSTPPSGSLFPIGQTTVNSTATDASGNHSYCTFTVTRAPLGFAGFLSPIGGADTTGGSFASPVRTFKMGSMIPVKFTASCGGSAVLTGVHRLQAVKYDDSTSAGTPIDATAQDTATTGNRFRFADGQWQFNLATKATGMSTGIWLLRAMLSDGSQHSAWIQIK